MRIGKSFLIGLFVMLTTAIGANTLTFNTLKCNAQINPIAIESEQPLLSWTIDAEGFNRSQSAYQVLVATKPNKLTNRKADVWNSDKVKSAQSTFVKYQGKELQATTKYVWKVRIWDEDGNKSDWSPVQSFETGLMNEANWQNAKWLGLSNDNRESEYRFRNYKTGPMKEAVKLTSQPAAYLRNEIALDKKVESARAYICGLGYYELYINGEKTGDHVLDPAPSNYDKQAYYVTYDVTEQLKKGENALGLILGNGFYGQSISWKRDPESENDMSYGAPAARLLIKVEYSDGTTSDFVSNENWKSNTGPIVFDNIYGGDTYDARYEIGDWNSLGYDATAWPKVKTLSPKLDKVSANQMPAIKKLHEFAPQKIFKSVKGNWIIDFGQNVAGWVKITVNEKKGQVINIIPTEALTQSGDDIYPGSTGGGANGMPQLLTYICKGNGPETWEPKFSYHGFRYAEVSGVSSKEDLQNFRAVLVATDVEQTGSFSCSDPLLNKMDTISKWTIMDNLHGIPEDCPHREKCGWLGDAHAFAEYALYNYDMANFYKKYMEDIRTQRRFTNGKNTDEKFRIPTMIAPGKRTSSIAKLDWGIAAIYLPWYNYVYYGDSSIVSEYYEDMKEMTNYYLSFKDEDGIIQNGMGDWCPPNWDRKRNPTAMECNPIVSANAYFFDILGIMERFAAMNNDVEYQQQIKKEKQSLRDAFSKVYLDNIPLTAFKWFGSQTATVMALQFGMVKEDLIAAVVKGLEYNIMAVKGGHHATGIHGNRYIYTVLNKYGKADLAHDILTVPTFPSQTYVMNYGFTTWPERQFYWDGMEGLSNSLNHPMHSGFSAYFFESLGGIKSTYDNPGYKVFNVKPTFSGRINSTSVTIPTPYGNIKNHWNLVDGILSMELVVPFNTSAKLQLSDTELKSLTVNNKSTTNTVLGSGKYIINYKPCTK